MEKSLQENKNIIQVIEDPIFQKGFQKEMSRVGNENFETHVEWKKQY